MAAIVVPEASTQIHDDEMEFEQQQQQLSPPSPPSPPPPPPPPQQEHDAPYATGLSMPDQHLEQQQTVDDAPNYPTTGVIVPPAFPPQAPPLPSQDQDQEQQQTKDHALEYNAPTYQTTGTIVPPAFPPPAPPLPSQEQDQEEEQQQTTHDAPYPYATGLIMPDHVQQQEQQQTTHDSPTSYPPGAIPVPVVPPPAPTFPSSDLDDHRSASSSQQTTDDIDAAIQRDAVVPGAGIRRLEEVGQAHWTDTDQQELDRLLAEGRNVYVPPDVVDSDLPMPRARGYSYTVQQQQKNYDQVLVAAVALPGKEGQREDEEEPKNADVDSHPNQLSMAERIAQWNQVVPAENSTDLNSQKIWTPTHQQQAASSAVVVVTDQKNLTQPTSQSPATPQQQDNTNTNTDAPEQAINDSQRALPSSPAEQDKPSDMIEQDQQQLYHHDQQQSDHLADAENHDVNQQTQSAADSPSHPPQEKSLEQSHSRSSKRSVDVTTTIFGGTFLTVPVVSKKSTQESNMPEHESQLTTAVAPDAPADDADEGVTTHEVLLRCESTAQVDVTADYGLKGGHSSIVHDATFVHNDRKLVTCGSDGKVCIWDMQDRSVQYEFTPYDGEPVTMIYPLDDDSEDTRYDEAYTLITLSQSRLLRIWLVDGNQAIMLRNSPIKDSETDLYMTVTPISSALKKKAIAAAAAAAVTTSDTPLDEEYRYIQQGTAAPQTEQADDFQAKDDGIENVQEEQAVAADEEERARKRFSITKVLSFGPRKAVAS